LTADSFRELSDEQHLSPTTKHRDTLKKILSTTDIENRILREVQEFPLSLVSLVKEALIYSIENKSVLL
jgi:hypothetical protein